ncbi:MAG TPA: HlyD family efflux transporter periplasmic adaptor subunit [Povalibacter sp.]|uniref:efflux RND transporter periplasmic adaptor subunit n=1 Tax=Povalibacter sp. TaxID=1962978 RepID=UPI002BAAC75E|nr:HlyD family efflux transporter periplasmic adaptor subunit [Povalibacter sp.]HMN46457.1 HlyD family efflux transporter periplasmic adaptor subunit [Povalibacter sp.]
MNRKSIVIAAAAIALLALLAWWLFGREEQSDVITLHGNVDLRQVDLPFKDSERIAAVLVEEGTPVKAGDVLARLDTSRLQPRVRQGEAQVTAQSELLRKLRNGARPEEIAQARAAVAAAEAEAANARSQIDRLQSISDASKGRAISTTDLEAAATQARMSEAHAKNAREALALLLAGTRKEDIEQAQAQLDAAEADLALLRQQLQDAELVSPTDGVIRNRLMEPGELATPQRPVFSIAIARPKWVRAYLSEPDLGRVNVGMAASVTIDADPKQPIAGTVGFISSTAEFTPKTVQTEELRTSLVYEVRILVQDPDDRMRLGMPATVRIDTTAKTAAPAAG